MPRKTASTSFASIIDAVVSRAAREIAAAVQAAVAAEPARGGRRGPSARKPGRPPRGPKAGRGRRRRGVAVDDATLDTLANFVAANTGLRSEEIQARTGLDAAVVGSALARLRETGRVRTEGQARGTRYLPPGRAARATRSRATRKRVAAKAAAPRKRQWPTCSVEGCGGRFFPASGKRRLCYPHFIEAGGKHPGKKG